MVVDVFWVSWHDNILAREYADQGMLEAVFSRDLWTPNNALEFRHHEIRGDFPDDIPGAVVILPARHHTSDEDVERFVAAIDKLTWAVVILSGDESWDFPWARVEETPTRKVWIMQPRPEHSHLMGIPGGWYPNTREYLTAPEPPDRPLSWFFGGQVTHARRESCAVVLRRMLRLGRKGRLIETEGYLQGVPKDEYFSVMRSAKVIPCPSGPMTVDTARPLEAMEAGCVPVVDMVTPRREDYDYWALCFGKDAPFIRVKDWARFPRIVQKVERDWPRDANKVFSWWQGYKRRLTYRLDNDIKEVSGMQSTNETVDDLITVIVSTSPCPIHPSTDHIEQVIDSIREQLPHAEILIGCDGVREVDEEYRANYDAYLNRLLWLTNFKYHNVLPVLFDKHLHQANMTKKLLEEVNTPYVLFVEHDTPIYGPIPFKEMTDALFSERAYTIRLHFDVDLHPDHEPLHFGRVEDIHGIPLRRVRVWWQRPHLSRTDFYRELLDTHFDDRSRTFIEDKVYSILHCDWVDHGPEVWDNWRIWTYMPEGSIKRSGHLDSRGKMPKHELVF